MPLCVEVEPDKPCHDDSNIIVVFEFIIIIIIITSILFRE